MAPAPAPSPDGIDTLISRIDSFIPPIITDIRPLTSSAPSASVTATFVNSASTTAFPSAAASTLSTLPSSSTPAPAPAPSSSISSISAPSLSISLNFFESTPTPTPTGLAYTSNSSDTMCDTTCIIAISTILGGVFLILSLLGIAYFILMKRRRRRLAEKDNDRALVAGAAGLAEKTISSTPETGSTFTDPSHQYPSRGAAGIRNSEIGQALSTDTGTPVDVTTMEGPPIGVGIVRRATDLANAVKEKLPGRGADRDKDRGRELGRSERGAYQGLESRSQSRLDEEGRPSRGLGWAV